MNNAFVYMGKTAEMTFGQQSGPPASPRQVQQLLALLQDAGHTDFRDARGPDGLHAASGWRQVLSRRGRRVYRPATKQSRPAPGGLNALPAARLSAQQRLMTLMPAEQLAVELRRRGWTVIEP